VIIASSTQRRLAVLRDRSRPRVGFLLWVEENRWIYFDFGARRVRPTAYAIRPLYYGPGGPHPKSWVIEASSDGVAWSETDHNENSYALNGDLLAKVFSVARASEDDPAEADREEPQWR